MLAANSHRLRCSASSKRHCGAGCRRLCNALATLSGGGLQGRAWACLPEASTAPLSLGPQASARWLASRQRGGQRLRDNKHLTSPAAPSPHLRCRSPTQRVAAVVSRSLTPPLRPSLALSSLLCFAPSALAVSRSRTTADRRVAPAFRLHRPNTIPSAHALATSPAEMTDYAKMKNAELEALLKQRSLPHTGKKAEMVARLQEADKADAANAPAEKPADSTAAPPEDEIDWDDDPTDAKPAAAAATTEAAATAIKAGGKGAVENLQGVPNQVGDIDPSKTDDLSVKAPVGDGTADAEAAEAAPVEKKDFASGLKETTLDEELEKRRARAKKFGLPEEDEAAKLLERAKKFGTDTPAAAPRGLNEALPERRPKRGRETGDEGRRGDSKRRGRGGRFQGRRGGGGGGGERRGNDAAKSNAGGSGTWMSAEDKARAEARKARFAGAPAS